MKKALLITIHSFGEGAGILSHSIYSNNTGENKLFTNGGERL